MTTSRTCLAIALALGVASALSAQEEAEPGGHAKGVLLRLLTARSATPLTVTSPGYANGADIPFEYTQYRGNTFPGIAWSRGPSGTRSYVVVMQGALGAGDDLSRGTSIHLNLYNIPASTTKLDKGLPNLPAGALWGSSLHGTPHAYVGPHTHNFGKQTYHLEVFALDTMLPTTPNMSVTDVAKLMTGHVLASGEVIGLATMDPDSAEGKAFAAKQAAGAAR